METPANHMTPTKIGEIAEEKLGMLNNVTVEIRCVFSGDRRLGQSRTGFCEVVFASNCFAAFSVLVDLELFYWGKIFKILKHVESPELYKNEEKDS